MEKWHKKWPESLNRRYQKGMTPEAIISKYGLGWSVSFSTHSLISGIFAALCQQGDPITARSTLLAFTEIQHALYDSCVGRTIHGGEIFPLFSFATFQLNRWEQEKKTRPEKNMSLRARNWAQLQLHGNWFREKTEKVIWGNWEIT